MIDPYFKHILEKMKPLREKEAKIDDKITMFKNLHITFTKDNGKFLKKYIPNIQNDQCIGYKDPEGGEE